MPKPFSTISYKLHDSGMEFLYNGIPVQYVRFSNLKDPELALLTAEMLLKKAWMTKTMFRTFISHAIAYIETKNRKKAHVK